MSGTQDFSFGDDSVAAGCDQSLVPILFDPWAKRLIEEHRPWAGRDVLDLAAGTGIVAQHLAGVVGAEGSVLATDINPEMLGLARKRCAGLPVEFVETPVHPLQVHDASIDFVVCQQGFQFFPDKPAAAGEIHRVLRPGGKLVATTWRSVTECQFFGVICDALDGMGESETAEMMRTPFNMHEPDLHASFESAGFEDVQLERQEEDMVMSGGVTQGIEVAYSTPIGPKLRGLTEQRQQQFRDALSERLQMLSPDGKTMGRMVTSVLAANKPQ